MHKKSYYIKLRQGYKPGRIKIIFLCESPPSSGKYFYNPKGPTTEPLFSAMMKLIGCQPATKTSGLKEFARQGYYLLDATYTPVDNIKNERKRNEKILMDLPDLIVDLRQTIGHRRVKIIFLFHLD